ncbi:Eco57I restriction-modification methylase domain-containing protein [Hymenobacter sp. B1770]|uniref:Eco57I restriction-modification methylase domain-containing protein n=1 Tax=Hymenobacter sp. B1770 TaxID=1718788 RepID=UPI003CF0A8F0
MPALDLLQHTQKLLDRVIFVCFCEDKNIIPRLTFRRLLDAVRANVFDPADDKVYRTVRGLFQSIDLGNPAANINRFNGGLFAPDAALDALTIKDRTLEPVISLERYDFASELNVNILGHIFEQSLADLEAERARLQGQAPPDAKQGKRKQDGIFYTPDYITRYIVGQAVGGWLRERRQETGLDDLPDLTDDDRATIRVRQVGGGLLTPSTRVQKHIAAWEAYGQRLRAIRVLDPACGSGAFLNEAFGYLLREGQVVNTALAELRAGQFEVFDLDRHILQHNLYGVDLNPESVQITRLSLWLQTANPGRPLTSLDHSIRCGNSLIADPAVAGERAFDWLTQFPEVFTDGGFDVVVGNPPYVRSRGLFSEAEKTFLTNRYKTASYQLDLYKLFIELALDLTSQNGAVAFITPSVFLTNEYDKKLREYLLTQTHISDLTFPSESVFDDAEVKTVVFNIIKTRPINSIINYHIISKTAQKFTQAVNQQSFQAPKYIINETANNDSQAVTHKLEKHPKLESSFVVRNGMKVRKELVFNYKSGDSFKPFVLGKDIARYSIQTTSGYVHYTAENEKLYTNQAFRSPDAFEQKKIIVRQIPGKKHLFASLDDNHLYADQTTYLISQINKGTHSLKYLLALLSSKLLKFYFDNVHSDNKETFPKVKRSQLLEFPVPNLIPTEQQPFITLADQLLTGHCELHAADAQFATLLRAELGLTLPLTGKLSPAQEWKAWSTALKKAIGRPLSLDEKGEWLPHLTQHQQKQAQRRQHLAQLDRQLDQLVYQLYHLTPTEIALVEG